ncbi:hypothetical protein FQR65_LT10732 [Abscondita terminalis]|nr:hypothetical protein FQR65_LT10732 [Abscondita terminalis]
MEQTTHIEYTVKPISEQYSEKALKFLTENFFGHDPITKCLLKNKNKSELMHPYFFEINKIAIKQGHSVMAIRSKTDDIIGLLINEKLSNEIPSTNPLLQKLIAGLNAKMNETVQCDNELLIRIAVVHPEFNKKGIAKALVLHTIKYAKEQGFEQIRSHCINTYFAKLCMSCGFKCIDSIAFEDFKSDGVVVFQPEFPHTHVQGLILRKPVFVGVNVITDIVMSFNNVYNIRIATKSDASAVHSFVKDQFGSSSPLINAFRNANIYEELPRRDDSHIVRIISDGLTLIATDDVDQIIGVVENVNYTLKDKDEAIPEEFRTNRMFCQIRYVLNSVDSQITSSLKQEVDKEMEVKMICVHKNWRQKGLGTVLLQNTIDLARKEEFSQLRIICISEYSRKLAENKGFKSICSVDYKEFKKQGKLDALPSPPHTNVTGLILKNLKI